MTIEEALIGKPRILPPEKQQEALDFVEFLEQKTKLAKHPRRSLLGLCTDLNVSITEEDIAEARKEMWGSFPKDIEL